MIKCNLQILIIFTLFVCNIGYSQTKYFDYNTVKFDDSSFPILNNNSDTVTEKKINQFLQICELELLNGCQTKNIFEKISSENGSIYGGKKSISYSIVSNNSKFLSIKFKEASCGATCRYWVQFYNFNSGNGDHIQLKDLIKPEYYLSFQKRFSILGVQFSKLN